MSHAANNRSFWRRLAQFSLSSLLLICLVFALVMGTWASRSAKTRIATQAIESAGGELMFDSLASERYYEIISANPRLSLTDFAPPGLLSQSELNRRAIIRKYLGRHFADHIEAISFSTATPGNQLMIDQQVHAQRIANDLDFKDFHLLPNPPPTAEQWRVIQSIGTIHSATVGGMMSDRQLAEIAKIKNLRTIHLSSRFITDQGMLELGHAKHLEHLTISYGCYVTAKGLASIHDLTLLESIRLDGTMTFDDESVKVFEKLTNLARLELISFDVSDEGARTLSKLTHLMTLDLNGNQKITDIGAAYLANMVGLQELELMETQISDEGLEKLTRLPNLRTLNVHNTKVSADGADAFREQRPSCDVIHFPMGWNR